MAGRGLAGGGRTGPGWPHVHGSYLPRGGICDAGEPASGAPAFRRPGAAGGPPGHPAHPRAGQWRSRSAAAPLPGPAAQRGGAGPDRDLAAPPVTGPAGAGSARKVTLNRVSARRAGPVTRHRQARPQPAAMRAMRLPAAPGRSAGTTRPVLPTGLATVSPLPSRPAGSACRFGANTCAHDRLAGAPRSVDFGAGLIDQVPQHLSIAIEDLAKVARPWSLHRRGLLGRATVAQMAWSGAAGLPGPG
jgi:hypothetical protein